MLKYPAVSILAASLASLALGATAPIATISLGTQPPFVSPVAAVVDAAKNRLYVFNGTSDFTTVANPGISVVDTSTNTVVGLLALPGVAGMTILDDVVRRPSAFLNPATHKIYAGYTNSATGAIVVVDANSDTVTQTLPIAGGIGNMAFNPTTGKLYVAQLSAATPTELLVFDINTLTQTATISGIDNGGIPQGLLVAPPIAVNPANNKIYTAAAGTGLLIIDGTRDVAEATLPLPAEIGELGINPVNNRVYAGLLPQTMWVVDGASDQLLATVNTRTVFGPFTVDPIRNIVYSGMGNGIQIDGATNTLETGPVFGNFKFSGNIECTVFSGNAVDFALQNWYSGCDGNLVIADTVTGNYKTLVSIPWVTFPGNGVINPVTHALYAINTKNNSVAVLDPATLKASVISLGNVPISIALNPVTNQVYVGDGPSNAVVVIDGTTNQVVTKVFAETYHPLSTPGAPVAVAADPGTNRYVFMEQNTAVAWDGATNQVVAVYSYGFDDNGLPKPSGFDHPAMNSVTGKMFTSGLNNDIYLSDMFSETFSIYPTVACPVGGIAVNTANNTYIVAENCGSGGSLQILDALTATLQKSVSLSASIPPASQVGDIFFNPASNKYYIVSKGLFSTVEVYNATTFAHLATIANVGGKLAANTALNAIYGTYTAEGGGIAVIDGNTDTFSTVLGAGMAVSGLAVNEATNLLYAGDSNVGVVNVFPSAPPVAGGFSISGQVVSDNGTGVAGVTISAKTATATSDSNGLFTLTGLKAGTYTLSPTTAGFFYGPVSQSVTLTNDSAFGVSFNALSTPIAVTGLTITGSTVIGAGASTTATFTLSEPAPAGGVAIALTSSNKAAKVPATVTVPAGGTSASFTIQGSGVSANTPVTVAASYAGSFAAQTTSASAGITVAPTDTLHIKSATWSKSTQILTVTATSTNAQSVLTAFLASNNQNLGTFTNLGGGNFSLQVSFTSGTPASVNVKSNLGGSTGQGVSIVQ